MPIIAHPPFHTTPVKPWPNGVCEQHLPGTDVYELPATREGVPARIEVQQRWRGLLPPRVKATDLGGHALEAGTSLRGLHRAIVVTDPRSLTQTVFDPREGMLEAQSPPMGTRFDSVFGRAESRVVHAHERVDREGNVEFRADDTENVTRLLFMGQTIDRHVEVTRLPASGQAPRCMLYTEEEERWPTLCGVDVEKSGDGFELGVSPLCTDGSFKVFDEGPGQGSVRRLFYKPPTVG